MSTEGDVPVAAAPEPVVPEARKLNKFEALQEVLKTALKHDGLVRGLREAIRCLDRREARLCIFAEDIDEANIVNLIKALCTEHAIQYLTVDTKKKLGEWAGLCKIDQDC